jgi:hypothetical protein
MQLEKDLINGYHWKYLIKLIIVYLNYTSASAVALKHKYNIKNLYIDSTVIGNSSGSLKFGYNIKIKNKKSIKITAIVDDNKVPHLLKVTPSNPHDSKIMEDIINDNNINNGKTINLIGDKGYIKSTEYINNINKKYNINLITPDRKNTINKKLIIIFT